MVLLSICQLLYYILHPLYHWGLRGAAGLGGWIFIYYCIRIIFLPWIKLALRLHFSIKNQIWNFYFFLSFLFFYDILYFFQIPTLPTIFKLFVWNCNHDMPRQVWKNVRFSSWISLLVSEKKIFYLSAIFILKKKGFKSLKK